MLAGYINVTAKTLPELEKILDKKNFLKEQTAQTLMKTMTQKNYMFDGSDEHGSPDVRNLLTSSSIDSLAFENRYELQLFQELLKDNSFIHPMFVARDVFNGMKWDFFIKTGQSGNDLEKKYAYDLYLPNNLKIWELAGIVKKLNALIYGGTIPDCAFSQTLKKDIEAVISYLISLRSSANHKEVKKAISKYCNLLQQYYPDEPLDSLSAYQTLWDDEMIWWIQWIDTGTIDLSVQKTDQLVSESIYRDLFLSIFEYGSEMLADIHGLETNLWVDNLAKKLNTVKKQKNITNTSNLEKQILQTVLAWIAKLDLRDGENMNVTSVAAGSAPSTILGNDQILCVWNAILLHSILQRLWIKHYGLDLKGHSAIMVELSNGQLYYIRIAQAWALSVRMEKIKNVGIREQMKIGKDTALVVQGDPDKILLSQQIGNMSNLYSVDDADQLQSAIWYMEHAIAFAPDLPFSHYTLANLYFKAWKYKKALAHINRALDLDPNYDLSRWLKKNICGELKDYAWYNDAYITYEKLKKKVFVYKNFKDLDKKMEVLKASKAKK